MIDGHREKAAAVSATHAWVGGQRLERNKKKKNKNKSKKKEKKKAKKKAQKS